MLAAPLPILFCVAIAAGWRRMKKFGESEPEAPSMFRVRKAWAAKQQEKAQQRYEVAQVLETRITVREQMQAPVVKQRAKEKDVPNFCRDGKQIVKVRPALEQPTPLAPAGGESQLRLQNADPSLRQSADMTSLQLTDTVVEDDAGAEQRKREHLKKHCKPPSLSREPFFRNKHIMALVNWEHDTANTDGFRIENGKVIPVNMDDEDAWLRSGRKGMSALLNHVQDGADDSDNEYVLADRFFGGESQEMSDFGGDNARRAFAGDRHSPPGSPTRVRIQDVEAEQSAREQREALDDAFCEEPDEVCEAASEEPHRYNVKVRSGDFFENP
jgi:hypothetical protein